VSGVQNVNLSSWHIPAVTLKFSEIEGQIMLAPKNEEFGLIILHPRLSCWIGIYTGAVVIKVVALKSAPVPVRWEVELIGPQSGSYSSAFGSSRTWHVF